MQPKALLIVIACLFIYGTSYSQKLKFPTAQNLSESKCLNVTIDSLTPAARVTLPFSSITVSDQRLDTTYTGYYYTRGSDKLSKVCVRDNVEDGINTFLNRYFITTPDSKEGSIYIQLKKFWIRNEDAYKLYRGVPEVSIHLKMEFYLKKEDCYYPLYRIDSVYYYKSRSDQATSILTRKGLIEATSKLARSETFSKRMRCISMAQIDSFNNVYRNIPALKEKVSAKGVYLTFSQFKENNPAYTEFDVVLDKESDVIFVKGKTLKDSAIIDAWGFSDGENAYIRVNSNFSLLLKRGDNFEFYSVEYTTNNPLAGSPTLVGRQQTYMYAPNGGFRGPVGNAATAGAATAVMDGILNSIRTTSKDIYMMFLNPENGNIY